MQQFKTLFKKNGRILINYAIAVIIFIIMTFIYPEFGQGSHIRVLLIDLAIVGFFALGQTFPVLTGGIDLSIPWMMNSAAVVVNQAINDHDAGVVSIIIIVILGACIVGIINGFGVAYLKVHPMIMTFGMNSILRGLLLSWTGGTSGGFSPDGLKTFAKTSIGIIPLVFIAFVVAVVLLTLVLTRTTYGKQLYALGNCRKAAFFSGVHVKRNIMFAYGISGLCAALGGLVMSGRVGQSYLGMGDSYMFVTLAVVAVGGVSLSGGSGKVTGTAGGALIITLLLSMMTTFNISTGVQQILYGAVLLFAIAMSTKRKEQGRHHKKAAKGKLMEVTGNADIGNEGESYDN